MYVYPLVGAIIALFGLCFPVVSTYDGVTLWSWGFYTIEHKSLGYFRINNEKEFETVFRLVLSFSFLLFLLMLFSLIIIIQISMQMKKNQISMNEAKTLWGRMSFGFFLFLFMNILSLTSIIVEKKVIYYKIGIILLFLGGFICLVPSLSELKNIIKGMIQNV
ncbi:hypothetical protein LCGC14_0415030 [marine sediment metagenome]|uniref:Uncharacterized protein n=1 Tax=marine sediment metagenome TaxID=412755 RepID=A0A0F9VEM8_9ZZZZ|nr:hypothetical protein [archaeon]